MPEAVSEAQRRADTEVNEPVDRQTKALIKPAQVVAGALAAVTAAVAASKLGVAGTLSGAALGSIVASVGGSVYERSINRTHARVRTTLQIRRAGAPDPDPAAPEIAVIAPREPVAAESAEPVRPPGGKRLRVGPRLAAGAVASFAVAIGAITAVELFAGEPVSGLTGGNGGSGTTIGRSITGGSTSQSPDSTPAPTAPGEQVEEKPVAPLEATPSTTATPTPSPAATAEATPSPSASEQPTSSTSQTPSSSVPAASDAAAPDEGRQGG